MTNYNEDILHLLDGETPKQKYETLLQLISNTKQFEIFIEGIKDTPDSATLEHIRNFIPSIKTS